MCARRVIGGLCVIVSMPVMSFLTVCCTVTSAKAEIEFRARVGAHSVVGGRQLVRDMKVRSNYYTHKLLKQANN